MLSRFNHAVRHKRISSAPFSFQPTTTHPFTTHQHSLSTLPASKKCSIATLPKTLEHKPLARSQSRTSKREPVVLNFQDGQAAFASKTTVEIIRAKFVLKLCSIDFIVNNTEKLMKVGKFFLRGGLFNKLMKMTFYGQFVGGTDLTDLKPKIENMKKFGVNPILDYSVEADIGPDSNDESPEPQIKSAKFQRDAISSNRRKHNPVARSYPYSDEESCEKNLAIFIECLETAKAACENDSFSAIKMTALTKPNALLAGSQLITQIREMFEQYSDPYEDTLPEYLNLKFLPKDVVGPKILLAERRMTFEHFTKLLTDIGADLDDSEINRLYSFMDTKNDGHVEFYKFRNYCLPNNKLYTLFTSLHSGTGPILMELSDEHIAAFNRLEARLEVLAVKAVELNARILVDAEQTYFQPIIDYYTNKLMKKYNHNKAYIFNTYQCYLKSTPSQLIFDTNKSYKMGYKLGAKLVRGAYMEQERQRAETLGYEDPIYPNKALTNSCYHNMVEVILRLVENKQASVMIASHNEFSVQYVVERMRQCDIDPQTGGVYFGQLLGMCDQVTFLLGTGGYNSYKYVPYGPVEAVLPYLSRRALENKGMLEGSQREKDMLAAELRRRKFGLQV